MRYGISMISSIVLLIAMSGAVAAEASDTRSICADAATDCTTFNAVDYSICGAFEEFWRVAPGESVEVYRTGLTAVIDLAFDPLGRLYALEAARGGLGAVDPSDPTSLAGALVRLNPDGSRTVVAADGLVFPTALEITPDGAILVANFGMVAGQGTLVEIDLLPALRP